MSVPVQRDGAWVLSDPDGSLGDVEDKAYAVRWLPFENDKWGEVGARLSVSHLCRIYQLETAWQAFIDSFDQTHVLEPERTLEAAKRAALTWVRDDLRADIPRTKANAEYERTDGDEQEAKYLLNDLRIMRESLNLVSEALSRDDLQSPAALWGER